jgi:nucleoside-diphosphate-sugar epimerase
MTGDLPHILVTGASGLVGRNFVEAARRDYIIYALARRAQHEVGIRPHPNIRWIQVDIGNEAALSEIAAKIAAQGQVEQVIHLAGYYDFEYGDHPEYRRTNIEGTANLLELSRVLGVERFIFASSLAACSFPAPGKSLDERSPPDADFAYARSKRSGEEMLSRYTGHFACTVVRLAAVLSDWCEYAPLYHFLDTWLSGRWESRVLGGRGRTAITYIHVRDLVKLFLIILQRSRSLPDHSVYIASPDGTVSHRQLFELAHRFFYGREVRPLFLPRLLALPGILLRQAMGVFSARRPFERVWMLRYLDRQLVVDAARTRSDLGWAPMERDHVLRRLLFMVENMTSHPAEWRARNEAAMLRVAQRPNLLIHEELSKVGKQLLNDWSADLFQREEKPRFAYLHSLASQEQGQYLEAIFSLLLASIRSVNRSLLLNYLDELTPAFFEGGGRPAELVALLGSLDARVRETASDLPALRRYQQELHSFVTLTLQLARDQVEVAHERFLHRPTTGVPPKRAGAESPPAPPIGTRVVDELGAYFQLAPDHELTLEDLKQLLAYMESKGKR